MNKLDALIDALKWEEQNGYVMSDSNTVLARRILEAVREDMNRAESECAQNKMHHGCSDCLDCPIIVHAATRAALEQLT